MLRIFDKFRRTRKIIGVFTGYGLDYFFDKGKSGFLSAFTKKRNIAGKLTSAAGFCKALKELGPAFIKLGQILSTRPDLLPPEFIRELESLQDQSPPFDSSIASEIIERELKKPVNELFRFFDTQPVAAASLSQVHKAELPDGTVVAVKIQRPGIRKIIEIDLSILQDLAGFVETRVHNGWNFRPRMMVEVFKKAIRQELDFTREANHLKKFSENFRDVSYISVPEVYRELTTPVVLTMEFIDGIKINESGEERYSAVYDPKLVALHAVEAILKQVFEDGFFHADPHPANLFVQPPANIVMLDVGMTGYLDKKTKILGTKIIKALVENDVDIIISCFEDLGIISGDIDRDQLHQDMSELFAGYLDKPFRDIEIRGVGQDIFAIIARHRLTFPSGLVLMIKALSMIESTGKKLYPDLDMMTIAKQFVRKVTEKDMKLSSLIAKGEIFLKESTELIEHLPGDLSMILSKAREGRLKLVVDFPEPGKISKSVELSGLHISLSIIISTLLLISSFLLVMPASGQIVTFISIAGYLIALFLIILLIRSLLKSKSLK